MLRKQAVRRLPAPLRSRLYELKDLYLFKTRRVSEPPPVVKQRTVRRYAREFGLRTLVETGTYRGEMIKKCLRTFDTIYSIELDQDLWSSAQKKFARYRHVHLVQGDSEQELSNILERLSEPALFWLDAHYSGGVTARGNKETPVEAELTAILNHPQQGHVTLIDDARHFTGDNGYPTVATIRSIVESHRSGWVVEVTQDILRIHAPLEKAHVGEG